MNDEHAAKPLFWVSSSLKDLRRFPKAVRGVVGYALYLAQCGEKHIDAKPLRGFQGAGVIEVVEDHDGDTYRAIYTVRLSQAVYVLHAFKKKSKKGIKTPKHELDLIQTRLSEAQEHYKQWQAKQNPKPRRP